MKLSDGEKLTLFMLADIYEHLGLTEVDPAFVRDSITDGHPWALKEKYHGIFHDDTPEETARQVASILGMWRVIEESYAQLDQTSKDRLAAEVEHFGKNPKFPGFDGNAGDGFYSAAEFLVKGDFGWEHFRGRSLNSHGSGPTDGQLRMLEVYRERVGKLHSGYFDADDLAAILRERIHPDRR